MNKTAIKNYAIWARVNLIESAKQRAYEYEITDGGQNNPNAEIIAGRPLSKNEQNQRKQLIEQIRAKGFEQVMEETAYTWFNRFIALRYMEVNGYLPSRVRVFTNEDGEFKPEILKEAMTVELDGLDREKILDLLDKQDNESLYKMLLIAQCNSLSTGLPYMFEKIANWTELLFPANLLKTDSIIGQMISSIPEDDWTDAVQIIGWLYQYYNNEKFDSIYDGSMSKNRVSKELLPSATQLFTPDWVVRYMVENSLGRIYIQRKLVSSGDWLMADEATKVATEKQEAEAMGWKYYLPEAEQDPTVREQLIVISNSYTGMRVEDIKVIDPCMGSGHILVYAFDVLMQIYTTSGWSERDAAKSILENNLYGLDIDDRAGQLAYFAVMMKARKYNRRILNGDICPNVMAIQDSSSVTEELINYVASGDKVIGTALREIRDAFVDAKEYGSLLVVKPANFEMLYGRIEAINASTPEDLFDMHNRDLAVSTLKLLIRQAEIMSQKYYVVVTNPPYMGSSRFSLALSEFINKNYNDEKSDLAVAMLSRMLFGYCTNAGFVGGVTTVSWMYLKSYEAFRKKVIASKDFVNLLDFGTELFEGKIGHLPIVSWVNRNSRVMPKIVAVDLTEYCYSRRDEKQLNISNPNNTYVTNQTNFSRIIGSPIAYSASDSMVEVFSKSEPLATCANPCQGLISGDVGRFVRKWFECSMENVSFSGKRDDIERTGKWFPYINGGPARKWYGNNEDVVNWEHDGFEIINFTDEKGKQRSRPQNRQYYFCEGITWSAIAGGSFALRFFPEGALFSNAGMAVFSGHKQLQYLIGFLNSSVAKRYLGLFNEGLNCNQGDVAKLPIITDYSNQRIIELVDQNIALAKADWDSYENSWDFSRHPLVPSWNDTGRTDCLLSDMYRLWESECEERFTQLKSNEEELNHIFINIYGISGEVPVEVDDSSVTIRKAELQRDIRGLISYAIGCMLGRYSLQHEGLAYAGGTWSDAKCDPFLADEDNIIPICDDEYFADDIVCRFVEFLKRAYGEKTLEENLAFIATSLGGNGSPREILRKYFLSDFYSDHLKIYQKRPIYWLFDSGKKNGLKCLIYMHRYQPDTIARIRTDYIHELQSRYRTAIADLEDRVEHAAASERVKLSKQLAKIKDQELELRKYEEKIHHLADQMIEIDLDDGVKVNYAKFGDVLAKIK